MSASSACSPFKKLVSSSLSNLRPVPSDRERGGRKGGKEVRSRTKSRPTPAPAFKGGEGERGKREEKEKPQTRTLHFPFIFEPFLKYYQKRRKGERRKKGGKGGVKALACFSHEFKEINHPLKLSF